MNVVLCEFFQITGNVHELSTTPIPFMLAILMQRGLNIKEAASKRPEAEREEQPGVPVWNTQELGGGRQRKSASIPFQEIMGNADLKNNLQAMINTHSGRMKG